MWAYCNVGLDKCGLLSSCSMASSRHGGAPKAGLLLLLGRPYTQYTCVYICTCIFPGVYCDLRKQEEDKQW